MMTDYKHIKTVEDIEAAFAEAYQIEHLIPRTNLIKDITLFCRELGFTMETIFEARMRCRHELSSPVK
jgi:hypothetical protein